MKKILKGTVFLLIMAIVDVGTAIGLSAMIYYGTSSVFVVKEEGLRTAALIIGCLWLVCFPAVVHTAIWDQSSKGKT